MLEMLLGRGRAKDATYKAFVAALDASKMVTRAHGSYIFDDNANLRFITRSYAGTSTPWGSPFGTTFTYDSQTSGIVCHAFPTLELYQHSLDKGLWCAMKTVPVGSQPAIAVDRNGLLTRSYSPFRSARMDDFIYYDHLQDKMMRWNPHLKTTPIEWDGTFMA